MKNEIERGAASIVITLEQGKITVTHGTARVVLHEVENAKAGSWDKIWNAIRSIESVKPQKLNC